MKLKKQFQDLHDYIKSLLTDQLKEKRAMFEDEIKNNFPSVCDEKGIEIKI